MKRLLMLVPVLLVVAPSFAKTHKDVYPTSCNTLWPAVKDTLRNSGKYGIISIDNNEMVASFNIGGTLSGKRINSVMLNSKGDNACEMQIQSAFSGWANNDYGDFKKRVEESLAKLQSAPAAKPDDKKDESKKDESRKDDK